jgi:hypothetical protein
LSERDRRGKQDSEQSAYSERGLMHLGQTLALKTQ